MSSTVETLEHHMERECVLLSGLYEKQVTLKEKIHTKDWNGLEETMSEMSDLADELVTVDKQRQLSYEKLQSHVSQDEETSFYGVVVRLPERERARLSDLYRKMKLSVLGIQTVTYCIDDHVQTINDTMHRILGELYPHRKGNIYSSEGMKREAAGNPLLFDRSL